MAIFDMVLQTRKMSAVHNEMMAMFDVSEDVGLMLKSLFEA